DASARVDQPGKFGIARCSVSDVVERRQHVAVEKVRVDLQLVHLVPNLSEQAHVHLDAIEPAIDGPADLLPPDHETPRLATMHQPVSIEQPEPDRPASIALGNLALARMLAYLVLDEPDRQQGTAVRLTVHKARHRIAEGQDQHGDCVVPAVTGPDLGVDVALERADELLREPIGDVAGCGRSRGHRNPGYSSQTKSTRRCRPSSSANTSCRGTRRRALSASAKGRWHV